MAFPAALTSFPTIGASSTMNSGTTSADTYLNSVTTDVAALEAKVGVTSSAVTTSHDYKLSGVTGTDKAMSLTGTETGTNKTFTSPKFTSPKLNEDVALTSTSTELNLLHGNLGAWTAWTPSWTNVTVGNGTNEGAYIQIGKIVFMRINFTLGNTSAITGLITLTLPVTIATYGVTTYLSSAVRLSAASTVYTGVMNSLGAINASLTAS